MARHERGSATESGRGRLLPSVLLGGGAGALAIGLLVLELVRPGTLESLGSLRPGAAPSASPSCSPTAVEVVTAPEAAPAVTRVVEPLKGRPLADGHCLQVTVRVQSPADTVASTRALPLSQAPAVWIPDTSVWAVAVADVAGEWPLDTAGSFASSPVLVVGGKDAVADRGWSQGAPSWKDALLGPKPISLVDLATSGPSLALLSAQWQALGGGENAAKVVAADVLAASRAGSATLEDVRQSARAGQAPGPVIVAAEASVAQLRSNDPDAPLVPLYPDAGRVPVLDYPVLRVGGASVPSAKRVATDVVVSALLAETTTPALTATGLRPPLERSADAAAGGTATGPAVTPLPQPNAASTKAFLLKLRSLTIPSRLLSVVDVSLSMKTKVPGSQLTRIQLAGQAAAAAGNLLTDRSSAGLWAFALDMGDGKPWVELAPVQPLGAPDNGRPHRQVVIEGLLGLPTKLSGGGTALYATTLAAVRRMRETYDPRAINSVVLFTDGTNENDTSTTLEKTVAALKADAAANAKQPVNLIAIGLGPDADLAALRAMTAAVGGTSQTYEAQTPTQLANVLYDALSRRPTAAAS